jgi:hypothetical protein
LIDYAHRYIFCIAQYTYKYLINKYLSLNLIALVLAPTTTGNQITV